MQLLKIKLLSSIKRIVLQENQNFNYLPIQRDLPLLSMMTLNFHLVIGKRVFAFFV